MAKFTAPWRRSTVMVVAAALAACGPMEQADELSSVEGDITTGQTFGGKVNSTSSSWVVLPTFTLDAPGTLSASLDWDNKAADLNLFFRDSSGANLVFANGTAKPELIPATVLPAGDYSFAIKCKSGSATYALKMNFTPTFKAKFAGQAPPGKLVWGSSIGGNADPVVRHETPAGHPLALHRTFYQWTQRTTSMVTTAKDDVAHHRLPWVSTKTPSWADMGAGKYDAEIDAMLKALDAVGGPVWLTLHHEPEGGGGVNSPDDPAGPAGHVAMNRRVRQRMTALGIKNVALAPILMSYSFKSASGRNPAQWWADGIYDFFGVDHYMDKEASLVDSTFVAVRAFAASHQVPVAVGEWGMRGTDAAAGQRVKDWFDYAANSSSDGQGAPVIGLSAFDSSLNSPSGSWELTGAQLTMFHTLMSDPRDYDAVAGK